MPQNFFTHKHVALVNSSLAAALAPVAVSTAVTVTAHTSPTPLFQTRVALTTQTGTGFGVLTQAYSYDGIIHTESFISDI